VIHWEDGGPTNADNLILLCSYHHGFVHERGWEIRRNPESGRWQIYRPDGHHVADHEPLQGASAEAVHIAATDWGLDLHADSLVPKHWDGWYDHDLAIGVMFDQLIAANNLHRDSAEAPTP